MSIGAPRHVNLDYAAWRSRGDLREENFDNVGFGSPRISKVNLEGASLQFVNMTWGPSFAVFESCNLDNADFSYSDCSGTMFGNSSMKGAKLKYSRFMGSGFFFRGP